VPSSPNFRAGTAADVDAATRTVTSAFLADPAWQPTLARLRRARGGGEEVDFAWWRPWVVSALVQEALWVTDGNEAVAVWHPIGAPELEPDQAPAVEAMLAGLDADDATYFEAFDELFIAARPAEPHWYLSLLATHGEHRGRGLGMALLGYTLDLVDAAGQAAYLESTNPANLNRYRSVGFEDRDDLVLPGGGPVVTTMWRDAR
jgi:GNAT superfamily N-acetyltransferase